MNTVYNIFILNVAHLKAVAVPLVSQQHPCAPLACDWLMRAEELRDWLMPVRPSQ